MRTATFIATAGIFCMLAPTACTTDDVDVDPPDNTPARNLFPIDDDAFAEYLLFLMVPGLVENSVGEATRYSLDIDLVEGVTELSLSKTTSAVDALTSAGVATATTKISNLDGIQHFVNLESLKITSNEITSLDVRALSQLSVLEMNFNLVGSLDLRSNPNLVRLRYKASASANDQQRLTQIDLSANSSLRHLYLPEHDLRAIDLTANVMVDDTLDLSENPGPDGDRATADIVVPAAIFDQVPPENRLGVISDADAPVQLSLTAAGTSFSEQGGTITVTASLNRVAEAPVTLRLALSGDAVQGVDYEIDSTMLTISPGATEANATITGVDDNEEEGAETVTVSAVDVMNAQAGVVDISLTINDDDIVVALVLNEVLYDPPADAPGDANGDGTREPNEDEFVELVNVSDQPADLSGFRMFDAAAFDMNEPRHTVPSGTILAPNQALVVFGGGAPVGAFGGAIVQVANGFENRLNLNNSGDQFILQDASGATLITFDVEPLSNNPDESYTRDPDLTGDFVQHAAVVDGVFYSPGTRTDGNNF